MSELPEPLRAAVESEPELPGNPPDEITIYAIPDLLRATVRVTKSNILAALAAAWPSVLAAEELAWWAEAKRLRETLADAEIDLTEDGVCTVCLGGESHDLNCPFAALSAPVPEPPVLVGELRKLVEEWRKEAADYDRALDPSCIGPDALIHCADQLAALLGVVGIAYKDCADQLAALLGEET